MEAAIVPLSDVRIVVDGLDHPECVTIDAEGVLWAGGEAGQIYRIDASSGTFDVVGSTDGFVLGITPDGAGGMIICDTKRREVLCMDVRSGAVDVMASEVEGRELINPNYAVFHPDGRLYVTDSGHWRAHDGFLFCIEPDGSACIVEDRCHRFPNGLALDYEADEIYIAESTLPGITKLSLRNGNLETVVTIPGTIPDGMALDCDRNIVLGCYRPDVVLKITEGQIETLVSDPEGTIVAVPTNVAMGGPRFRTLYMASLGRWHIGAIELKVPGLPLAYPGRG